MFVPLVDGAGGGIDDDTVTVLASVVAAHAALAREAGASHVQAVATAAIRRAVNREALCAAIHREAGLRIRVLDDAEEARLAFAGATRTIAAPPDGTVGVGSGVLTERLVHGDPPTPDEIDALRAEADTAFAGITAPRMRFAYAVGGSATSLRQLCGDELSPATLDDALGRVSAWPVRDA